MREPIMDEAEFEPFDVLLEEALAGAGAIEGEDAVPVKADTRGAWLAAALLLLGVSVVVTAALLSPGLRDAGAAAAPTGPAAPAVPPSVDAQDPLPADIGPQERTDAATRTRLLESVSGMRLLLVDRSKSDPLVAVPGLEVRLEGDRLARIAHGLADLLRDAAVDVQVGDAPFDCQLQLEWSDGRRSVVLLSVPSVGRSRIVWSPLLVFSDGDPVLDELRDLYLETSRAERLARGEVWTVDDLRALPGNQREIDCRILKRGVVRQELPRFQRLRRLVLQPYGPGSMHPGEMEGLQRLSELAELRVVGEWFGDQELEPLLSTRLEHLALSGTLVTEVGLQRLGGLATLRELVLAGGMIDPEMLAGLGALTQLRHLELQHVVWFTPPGAAPVGVDAVRALLPNCEVREIALGLPVGRLPLTTKFRRPPRRRRGP